MRWLWWSHSRINRRGRSKKLQYPPVKEDALAHNIEVFQPKRLREAESIEYLKKYQPDCIVVVAFGQILPKEILEMPKYWLCECSCIPASEIPWSSTDPVGSHQWRKSQWRYHDAYG